MHRTYHDLVVWQRAVRLAKLIYAVTGVFPSEERFGLASQMRRAAVSVASNIAEGASRMGKREFLKFLSVARGSLAELETQLTIAQELGLIGQDATLREEIEGMFGLINGLMNSLKQ